MMEMAYITLQKEKPQSMGGVLTADMVSLIVKMPDFEILTFH